MKCDSLPDTKLNGRRMRSSDKVFWIVQILKKSWGYVGKLKKHPGNKHA